jgi:hypothetical protein
VVDKTDLQWFSPCSLALSRTGDYVKLSVPLVKGRLSMSVVQSHEPFQSSS